MRNRKPRRGFTLLEILAVLALLLILGAIIIPSTSALYGNVRQKAAADIVRARLADARALAMETGTPYRIAISEDFTKVRVAPDLGFAEAVVSTQPSASSRGVESTLEKATAQVIGDPDDPPPLVDNGYVTVATFLPDGTCKEDRVTIHVLEDGFPPLRIEVRGVTGTSRTLPQQGGEK